MNYLQRLEHWGETHHPQWMVIVRIVLGVFLCYKGIEFLSDTSVVVKEISENMSFGSFTLVLLSHYIVFAHLLGGFLIALGIITRIASLLQIPILLGAIIFINAPEGLWQPFSEIWLSIIVLLLLVYFSLAGDGRWSFNWIIDHEKKK
jgi:uncharacterized membrane protein YphA (DoxX/SURF4 family)